MLFNSIQFLIFFPIVTIIYFLLSHTYRWIHLLVASCIFYMGFIPAYVLILFATIIIDYIAGILIENITNYKTRKLYLLLSICVNIGILIIFKYYNFFIENSNELLTSLHFTISPLPYLNIILPIGLSFHTFQAMSYTIEVYRKRQKAERHFGIYALYVMFYPQLVAGPIERPQNLLHQFKEKHYFNSENLLNGLRLMLWGFFKKVVIADRVGIYVNSVFNFPDEYHYLNLIIAVFFFAIQIYCDFSGYSDIAIGAAKTMGFNLMTNFNKPYLAKNIQEFWRKWHISLSTWFKDYLYIELGGNRIGIRRMYLNVAIIFLVSGFWHGANWTYIIWGALHAFYVLLFIYIKRNFRIRSANLPLTILSSIFMFILVAFAWIFFRSTNLNDAFLIIHHIFTLYDSQSFTWLVINQHDFSEFGLFSTLVSIAMIIILFVVEHRTSTNLTSLNKKYISDILFCTLILFLTITLGIFNNNSFVYFQF